MGSFATHGLDGILIAEIQPAFRGVKGMGFPGIVLSQRRIDAPLGRHRMAANRMDLRHHGDVKVWRHGNRCPHPCQAGSDNQNIVLFHSLLKTGFSVMSYRGSKDVPPPIGLQHSYVTLSLKASPETLVQPLEKEGRAWYSAVRERLSIDDEYPKDKTNAMATPDFLSPTDTFVHRHLGPTDADVCEMLDAVGLQSLK